MLGFLFRTLSQKRIEFLVGSPLKPVLLVVFFLRYSDFPSFMKADIFKFKNTTDNPSATVASLSAAYFWLKLSRVILINTWYFINHSQVWREIVFWVTFLSFCLSLLPPLTDDERWVQKAKRMEKNIQVRTGFEPFDNDDDDNDSKNLEN